jgi:protease secretion system membrane fusion protein
LKKSRNTTEVVSTTSRPGGEHRCARHARSGWLIVLLGFGGFLLWACLAPLDKGVPMSGTVAKESNRKAVQHQTGGTSRKSWSRTATW